LITDLNIPTFMIIDADVLIDFIKAEKTVLKLFAEFIGTIYISSTTANQVDNIENNELTDLGLIIIEPDIEDIELALDKTLYNGSFGRLGFEDSLCFLTAKRNSYTCITNDKILRKLCQLEKISILWGLELLLLLYKSNGISAKEAINIAHTIKNMNSNITQDIITYFIEKVNYN
jgi:hypothetical protein